MLNPACGPFNRRSCSFGARSLASVHKYLRIRDLCKELGIVACARIFAAKQERQAKTDAALVPLFPAARAGPDARFLRPPAGERHVGPGRPAAESGGANNIDRETYECRPFRVSEARRHDAKKIEDLFDGLSRK